MKGLEPARILRDQPVTPSPSFTEALYMYGYNGCAKYYMDTDYGTYNGCAKVLFGHRLLRHSIGKFTRPLGLRACYLRCLPVTFQIQVQASTYKRYSSHDYAYTVVIRRSLLYSACRSMSILLLFHVDFTASSPCTFRSLHVP